MALTSALEPTNSDYSKFYIDLNPQSAARGFDVDFNYPCHHSREGFACFLRNSDGTKRGTLVVNRSEVAAMYANVIRRKGNESMSKALVTKKYSPSVDDGDFLDKAGIAGFHIFFNMYGRSPSRYDYDDSFGVRIKWDNEGKEQVVETGRDDISRISPGNGLDVFRKIGELFRQRFEAAFRPKNFFVGRAATRGENPVSITASPKSYLAKLIGVGA